MKLLEQIKDEYAQSKNFHSWEQFCSMANDNMFMLAVDEVAGLYANRLAVSAAPNRQNFQQPFTISDIGIERFG